MTLGDSGGGVGNGTSLSGQDVIVVSINYRLGPLGFLPLRPFGAATGTGGMNGLHDQIQASRKKPETRRAAFLSSPPISLLKCFEHVSLLVLFLFLRWFSFPTDLPVCHACLFVGPLSAFVCHVSEALRWIQRYIGAFGGDAKRVTLFGCSAGSLSICTLAVSPLAKDLFHQDREGCVPRVPLP